MATTTSIILYRGSGTAPQASYRLLPRYGALNLSGGGSPGAYVGYRNLPRYGQVGPIVIPPAKDWTPPPLVVGGMESALGGERRRRLHKAIHEALTAPEPPPKRQPSPKKPRNHPPHPITMAPPTAEARVIGEIPKPVPPLPPLRIAGNAHTRGLRESPRTATVRPSGGVRAELMPLPGARYTPRTGMLSLWGAQNLTIEQELELLHAA